MHLVLGINFGGTFTDIVALDTGLRRVFSTRTLTTSQASNHAVAEDTQRLMAAHG
jgi:N-methylhydantoinase A/oxoprolinase/acetone carboxylase beta subunit